MRRRFARQLNNIFAKIRLNRLDPDVFKRMVDMQFLGHHRLGLDYTFCLLVLGDLHRQTNSVCCICCKMNMYALRSRIFDEFAKIVVQVRNRMQPNLPASLTPLFPVPKLFGGAQFTVFEPFGRELNRIAKKSLFSATLDLSLTVPLGL